MSCPSQAPALGHSTTVSIPLTSHIPCPHTVSPHQLCPPPPCALPFPQAGDSMWPHPAALLGRCCCSQLYKGLGATKAAWARFEAVF